MGTGQIREGWLPRYRHRGWWVRWWMCQGICRIKKKKLASHRGWTTTTLYYNRQQEPIISAPLMALPAAGQQELIQYGSFIVSLLPYLMANI